jgi:sulfur-oxidizing protein SoxY
VTTSIRVGRRAFLAGGVVAGAALLHARPSAADAARAAGSPEASEPPTLKLPRLTENGAKVPVIVEMAHPMESEHHLASVRVENERDPIVSKGEFHFTPANGQAYLAFQARLDDGVSAVRVAAECSRGRQWSAAREIRVAAGGGGCAGPLPARDREEHDIRPPVIRIPQELRGQPIEPGHVIDVQVKLKHPVRTGLVQRDGRWVPETEPFYLTGLDVYVGSARVSRFVLTPALSDDPLITFRLRPREEALLRVLFRNSRGAELEASHPIRFG